MGGRVRVSLRGGVFVWSGVVLVRWGLPSTASSGRISQMRARTCSTSRSVVGRGYLKGGVTFTRRRISWMVW